jgi:uncharacterized protein YwbE
MSITTVELVQDQKKNAKKLTKCTLKKLLVPTWF